ncbi:MAG: haloalkane dehalogenase [Actinomycetota bacterium]
METLRTPDDRFAAVPDFPYEPRYADVPDGDGGTVRMAWVEAGPPDGPPVLLLHGEPSWGFLYRKMMPVLADAGLRSVVPDLVGFGRSDKPVDRADVTYARQVAWTTALVVDHLDLRGATFFGQDWGGLIGLRVVLDHPERFDRIVVSNTGLPTGHGEAPKAFLDWRRFSQESPEFPIGGIVQGGSATELPPAAVAAYDAPFPDESFKETARIMPSLVPIDPADPGGVANQAAWEVLRQWDKPLLTAFGDADPVTGGGHAVFEERVPGAQGQPHTIVAGGGHFIQEDRGPELASIVAEFVASTG